MRTPHSLRPRMDVHDVILAVFAATLLGRLPRQPLVGWRRTPDPRNRLVIEVLTCGHEAMHGDVDRIAQWIAEGKERPCPACASRGETLRRAGPSLLPSERLG